MAKKLKNGGFAVELEQTPELWRDRKRYLGLPISFTRYSLNEEKLLVKTGLLNLKEDEIRLYRIRDVSMTQSLTERLFGVGTVCISSSDTTLPHLDLKHVKNPGKVKDVVSQCVETSRRKNGIRSTELMNGGQLEEDGLPAALDADGDGIADHLDNDVQG